jgi:hypothetical protein
MEEEGSLGGRYTMQISLYIGERKKKDKIVNEELLKFVEGDRSDRIKDLILKGLIFEGKKDINEKLLDMRYLYDANNLAAVTRDDVQIVQAFATPQVIEVKDIDVEKPNFNNIKVVKSKIIDDDLEERI